MFRLLDGILILLVLVTGGRFAWSLGRPTSEPNKATSNAVITLGSQLPLPDLAPEDGKGSVLLAISTTCRACRSNVTFYRELSHALRARQMNFVMLAPQDAETTRGWATEHGFQADRYVRLTDPSAAGLSAVPTILILSPKREVLDLATGALSAEQQGRILQRISDATAPPVNFTLERPTLDEMGVKRLLRRGRVQILSIRERTDRAGLALLPNTLVVPADELRQRVPVELNPGWTTVVDCRGMRPAMCARPVSVLNQAGIQDIFFWTIS